MRKKLCHNCDAKPVLAAKTDIVDDMRLLILGNLLKTQLASLSPVYQLAGRSWNLLVYADYFGCWVRRPRVSGDTLHPPRSILRPRPGVTAAAK